MAILRENPDDAEPESADSSESFSARAARADAWEREKEVALENPGPGWSEWFLYSGAKAWVVLGFFVVNVWLFESWVAPLNAVGLGLSLAAAVYLEFLAYRYLWYRIDLEAPRRQQPFRRTFLRPREVGRWTPEAALVRQGKLPGPTGPRRDEFL